MGDVLQIVDYVLSCRVMGRRVEETMVHIAVAAAIERGASTVVANYLPTAKNKPCPFFLATLRFRGRRTECLHLEDAKPVLVAGSDHSGSAAGGLT